MGQSSVVESCAYFCKYQENNGIHYLDYSGVIDLVEGMSRISNLVEYFTIFKNNNVEQNDQVLKVLMDAQEYVKISPEIHDELAKKARQKLSSKFDIKLAVVQPEHDYILSDREAWFSDYTQAVKWLENE